MITDAIITDYWIYATFHVIDIEFRQPLATASDIFEIISLLLRHYFH